VIHQKRTCTSLKLCTHKAMYKKQGVFNDDDDDDDLEGGSQGKREREAAARAKAEKEPSAPTASRPNQLKGCACTDPSMQVGALLLLLPRHCTLHPPSMQPVTPRCSGPHPLTTDPCAFGSR
jgi:hypothetical protein